MLGVCRFVWIVAVCCCSMATQAQFLPEDQIPLDIQQQIIADVISKYRHPLFFVNNIVTALC